MRAETRLKLLRPIAPAFAAAGLHIAVFIIFFFLPPSQSKNDQSRKITIVSLKEISLPVEISEPKEKDDKKTDPDIRSNESPRKDKHRSKIRTGSQERQTQTSRGENDTVPKTELPGVSHDTLNQIKEVDGRLPIPTPGSVSQGDFEATQKTLLTLKCLKLAGERNNPECTDLRDAARDGGRSVRPPGWTPVELGENPFETSLDRLKRKQYKDRSTPYSLTQTKSSDHQHANPFFGTQNSAEKDLTGRVRATPDPVWGD